MFSLVVTIISIALVAALALATLYYGGNAFNQGSAKAQAAKVENQGQQLLGAAELFKANNGRYPANVLEMVSSQYLRSEPQARLAVSETLAANPWYMPAAGEPVFLVSMPAPETCRKVNENAFGTPGILTQASTGVTTQCFGPSLGELRAMASRGRLHVQAVAVTPSSGITSQDLLEGDTVPTSEASPLWLVKPSAPRVATPASNSNAPGDIAPSPAPGVLTLSTSALSFNATDVGQSSTRTLTLSNTGESTLTLTAAPSLASGLNYSASTNCGASLAPAAACAVIVTFEPTAGGSTADTLTLVSDVSAPVNVSISGVAVVLAPTPGELTLSASAVSFADTEVGQSSSKTFTLSNTGESALAFTAAPSIASGSDYSLSSTCGASLPAAGSCVVTLTFAPTAAGTRTGTLAFDTDVSTPASVGLSGSGTQSLSTGFVQFNGLTWSLPDGVLRNTYKATLPALTAQDYCAGTIDGTTGWRLPLENELKALALAKGTLDLAGKGWPNLTSYYWSGSSLQVGGSSRRVNMPDGVVSQKVYTVAYTVTCVK